MATEWWAVGLTLLSVAVGAFGPILLKKGTDGSLHPKHILRNKHLIAGIFLYGVATIIYLLALRGGELSLLYPLVSITYPVVCILSIIMLKERMNRLKWAGIVCIIAGVSFIGLG